MKKLLSLYFIHSIHDFNHYKNRKKTHIHTHPLYSRFPYTHIKIINKQVFKTIFRRFYIYRHIVVVVYVVATVCTFIPQNV